MSHPAPVARTGPLPHCMDGCVCAVRAIVDAASNAPQREPTDLDNAEARALLAAVESGYAQVCRDPRLAPRRHSALSKFGRAARALAILRHLIDVNSLERHSSAATEARSLAQAAPNHRPLWLRLIRWPLILVVGTFDTWYFMQVFQYVTSSVTGTQFSFVENLVSAVPGIVLALGIAFCGTILVIPLDAWRNFGWSNIPAASDSAARPAGRQERWATAPGRLARFLARLAWRLLPVAFASVMLTVVALWAYLRARGPSAVGGVSLASPYPLPSVALLIVMLSFIAIAVKVAANDPLSERASRTIARLWLVRQWHRFLTWRCARTIDAYAAAWSDLATLRDELLGVLRLAEIAAWEGFILRTRALHGKAGHVPPALTSADPGNGNGNGVAANISIPLPEFENVRQPRPELGPLREICRIVNEQVPEDLRRQKAELDRQALSQLNP